MATNINNLLTNRTSGKIGKQMVLKDMNGKTLVTKYPDRTNVILSPRQRKSNTKFAKAVVYAQTLNSDPVRKAELKKKLKSLKRTLHQTPYHAAIQEYMLANASPVSLQEAERIANGYQLNFQLSPRQANGLKFLALEETLDNAAYQNINKVSKSSATRDLKEMVSKGIITITGKGAGTKYSFVPLTPAE